MNLTNLQRRVKENQFAKTCVKENNSSSIYLDKNQYEFNWLQVTIFLV